MSNRLTPRKANSRSHGQSAKIFTDIRDMPGADLQMLKRPSRKQRSHGYGFSFNLAHDELT